MHQYSTTKSIEMSEIEVVLVNESFQYDKLLVLLNAKKVIKSTSNAIWDIILKDCISNLAIKIVTVPPSYITHQTEKLDAVIRSIEYLNNTFAHCCVIVLCDNDYKDVNGMTTFDLVNVASDVSHCRIFQASSIDDCAYIIKYANIALSNKSKYQVQKEYFINQQLNLVSPSTARGVYHEYLKLLKINEQDIGIIIDYLPSFVAMFQVKTADFERNCPCDMVSIHSITHFLSLDNYNVNNTM